KYSELVEMEREEEMERHKSEIENLSPEERQDKGRALLNVKGKDEGQGLGGDHIVKFSRKSELPEHEISVGDLVMVSKNEPLNPDNPTGTVVEKTRYSVSVAFPGNPPGFVFDKNLRVDLYVNDITFQRMLEAMNSFSVVTGDKMYLREIFLGKQDPRFGDVENVEIKNDELDGSQREAVKESLEAEDLFLIHGPPGTGKTTALIEAIQQHVERGCKVLATADSNVAVDNLVDFLNQRGVYAVRVGHPARVTETLREHTLDFMVEKMDKYKESQELWAKVEELGEEQDEYTFPSGKWRRGMDNKKIKKLAEKEKGMRGVPPRKIKEMAKWIKLQEGKDELAKKAKRLEQEAVDEIMDGVDVVCTTNSTAGSDMMEDRDFDVVIIDEATQATEPSCLIPMNHANKVVMAGDHKQLPPTILNQEAKEQGLEETLFERMIEVHGDGIKKMLETQYRMNTDIMNFPSQEFYDGELKAAEGVAGHKLQVSGEPSDELMGKVLNPENIVVFLDSRGEWPERSREGSTSKENRKEAEMVEKVVRECIDRGVPPEEIGVISPYDDQVDLLNSKMDAEGLEIKTVDGFQGREKEVIVLSFVRSNENGEIGFLKDLRRLNVSITRARKKLIMVGDSETLEEHPTYKRLLNYVEEIGKVLKAN
ncbi:MAG: IGHMBP2 family helicase, partial [Candidatus Aenigmatarchaeota archaeon]